jgi:RNA polymerase sigma factor (sigma-70 family)
VSWTASEGRNALFPTTQWSRVIAAGKWDAPEARESLSTLCAAYWYPLYAFVRRRGHAAEQAKDLTQDFFALVLEKDLLAKADPNRGRFRSFLRTVCARFLANSFEHASARKRGGGRPNLPFDVLEAEGRYMGEMADHLTPERIFDRSWTMTLLGSVLDQLRREYDDAGRLETFDQLKDALIEGQQSTPYAAIAERLGSSEGAVRVAAHRLRRRYGILLRQQIAATVGDPAEVDDEIRALFGALGP